jgi:hypothetical protein
MSCWVVPALAAEYWGVSVETVLAGIRSGDLRTREEHGFTFVDVAPAEANVAPEAPPPPTFSVVTRAELAALSDDEIVDPETNDEASLADWREVRRETSMRRKPPIAA